MGRAPGYIHGEARPSTGHSPLQVHGGPEPVPFDDWLPCHVGILQQEVLERSEQGKPASPNITLHNPALPSITPVLSSITSITQHHPISLRHPAPGTHDVQQESGDTGTIGEQHKGLSGAEEGPVHGIRVAGEQRLPAGPELQLHGLVWETLLQLRRKQGWAGTGTNRGSRRSPPLPCPAHPVLPVSHPACIPSYPTSHLCPLLPVSHPTRSHLWGEDLKALGLQLNREPLQELEGSRGSGCWDRRHRDTPGTPWGHPGGGSSARPIPTMALEMFLRKAPAVK